MKARYLIASLVGGALGIAIGGWITYEEFFEAEPSMHRLWAEIEVSDTLRIVTVPSSISAFQYKGGWRGHEYEVVRQVSDELGLYGQLIFAPDEQSMLDSVAQGVADVAAWPVPACVMHDKGGLRQCGYTYEMGLVPVLRREVELADAEVEQYRMAVPDGSWARHALENPLVLQNFNVAPFRMMPVADTVNMEPLTDMLVDDKFDAILLPTSVAQLMRSYYPDLKLGHPLIDSEDSIGWVVSAGADTLAAKIDSVCSYDRSTPRYATLIKRYYEQSLGRSVKIRYLLGNGRLSVYDQLFRTYSKRLRWDWRLLAAVAFVESRFDPHEISSKGARGLMQLMPTTATRFGCPAALMTDPEANVRAGAQLIESMEGSLRRRILRAIQPEVLSYNEASAATKDSIERDLVRFTLASYNAGMGHVFDAIALADTLGYNPAVWTDNVEHCLRLKADPEYYTLPCVHHGRFRARVTVEYVREVLDTYQDFCRVAPN